MIPLERHIDPIALKPQSPPFHTPTRTLELPITLTLSTKPKSGIVRDRISNLRMASRKQGA